MCVCVCVLHIYSTSRGFFPIPLLLLYYLPLFFCRDSMQVGEIIIPLGTRATQNKEGLIWKKCVEMYNGVKRGSYGRSK